MAAAAVPAVIPFDEIVPGASVRFTFIDGKQYLSIRDIIVHMCGVAYDYAGKIYRRMSDEHKAELSPFCQSFQFPGAGQSQQPVISFPGAIKLSMFLPGENAKKNRSAMAGIIHRYFAGDKSLLEEIEANARSDHPMAQMARDSLPSREELEDKKRKREMEDAELQNKKTVTQNMRIANISSFATLMDKLSPNWIKDDRLVMQTQDLLKNTMFTPIAGQASLENGASAELVTPITISQVAQDMDSHLTRSQSIKIGRVVAEKYREKYGEDPSKHQQYVDGATRMVNSYTEKDRSLIEEAIREFFDE